MIAAATFAALRQKYLNNYFIQPKFRRNNIGMLFAD